MRLTTIGKKGGIKNEKSNYVYNENLTLLHNGERVSFAKQNSLRRKGYQR